MTSDIVDYFPEYDGPKQDEYSGRTFLAMLYKEQYLSSNRSDIDDRPLFIHFTCATDIHNIEKIFNAIKDTILMAHIEELNLA